MMNWGRFGLIILFAGNCAGLSADVALGNAGWWLPVEIFAVVALGLANYAACHS